MKISEIGERELLRRLFPIFKAQNEDIIINAGDDAASVRSFAGQAVMTTDILIEDVHFKVRDIKPHTLGRKSLAVSISDIAAMAARPLYAMISLGLPPDTTVDFVTGLYQGLSSMADEYGVAIVGGDIAMSDKIIINVALYGTAGPDEKLTRRDAARSDDLIMVTGTLGGSALGLELLLAAKDDSIKKGARFINIHQDPSPRVVEAQIAAKNGVLVIEDISDGLLTEISHICEMSGTGALVDARSLPLPEGLESIATGMGLDPIGLALMGGEDYELVLVAPSNIGEKAAAAILEQTGTQVRNIGKITKTAAKIEIWDKSGKTEVTDRLGYEHFRE